MADLLGTTSLGRCAAVHARAMEDRMALIAKQNTNGRRLGIPVVRIEGTWVDEC